MINEAEKLRNLANIVGARRLLCTVAKLLDDGVVISMPKAPELYAGRSRCAADCCETEAALFALLNSPQALREAIEKLAEREAVLRQEIAP
jgi:hypothetical protein